MNDAAIPSGNAVSKLMRHTAAILRMIKFEHTLFALPLAFAGAFLAARSWPSVRICALILLAMFGARSAAMTFNRLVDAEIDARNPRTAAREIPSGIVRKGHSAIFTALCAALFFFAAWQLNPLCFALSPFALILVLFYSFTKRFTILCHVFLGLGLSLAPIGGWVAVTGTLDWRSFALAGGVLFWVAGFDILYSSMDADFDRRYGLKSLPAFLGVEKAFFLAKLFHLSAFIFFVTTGLLTDSGWPYFLMMVIVLGLLMTEHMLVSPRNLNRMNTAFFSINSFVSMAYFLGVFFDNIY